VERRFVFFFSGGKEDASSSFRRIGGELFLFFRPFRRVDGGVEFSLAFPFLGKAWRRKRKSPLLFFPFFFLPLTE